jgi:hypothetical protein
MEHRRLGNSGLRVARLDKASDVRAAYPVSHPRGFPVLNERG